jgi:hypothetical protein
MINSIKNYSLTATVILVIWGILVTPIPNLIKVVSAQTDGVCEQQLTQAEEEYNTGRFDQAIGLITECLGNPGISEHEKMRAYRLLGLAYIAKDYLEDAKTAVKKLLDMVPNYQSDPVQDPPPFTKLVEEVKEQKQSEEQEIKPTDELSQLTQLEEEKGSKKKWYIIGGGVAAAGIIVAIIAGGGGNGNGETIQPLPGPPNVP